MPTPVLAPVPAPLFYTLPMFKAAGLPGKTKAYELDKLGLLNLVSDPAGRRGVTADEARRYFSTARPRAEVNRDVTRATAASLKSRRAARQVAP